MSDFTHINTNDNQLLIKQDDDKYEIFFKNYLNKDTLTKSTKSFVKKILFLENSFKIPSSIRAKAAAEQLSVKMKAREELLASLINEVTSKLAAIADDTAAYEQYIIKMMVQECIKLQETKVTVACKIPEKKHILEIIDMLCSEKGQDILHKNPKFRNLEIRNVADYTDYFDYDDFPDVFDRWKEMFGKFY